MPPLRDINPRLLRCFVALAEELHSRRAADRLAISQPALTRDIQQLENILDRRLFLHTAATVELMPSGRALLLMAHEALTSVES